MNSLRGVGRQMPITFTGFVIAGLALIGVPLTAGFISKLYLFKAIFETGNGIYVAVIAVSSALSVLYLWKIFEVMWLQEPLQPLKIEKEPVLACVSLWLLVFTIIIFGIYSAGVSSYGMNAANALIGVR
jgi:multicomponent Na+:H+ antiporter subunit D